MPAIHIIVPNPESLLALEIPEAGWVLLQHLAWSSDGSSPARPVLMSNFFNHPVNPAMAYSQLDPAAGKYTDAITEHLIMAWQWLLRENLLIPAPGNTQGWVCVSTRGHKALQREVFDKYRHAALLPQAMLHPSIEASVFSAFLRAEYDLAIFAAFRGVENNVRETCKLSNNLVGVKLMRAAFDPGSGPLTNKNLVTAEQEAMANLFAGAMGSFKNPASHRTNAFNSAEEALSLILFANYLVYRIDELAQINGHAP
jgi:uncharacterized protein (TIGR02391 family)